MIGLGKLPHQQLLCPAAVKVLIIYDVPQRVYQQGRRCQVEVKNCGLLPGGWAGGWAGGQKVYGSTIHYYMGPFLPIYRMYVRTYICVYHMYSLKFYLTNIMIIQDHLLQQRENWYLQSTIQGCRNNIYLLCSPSWAVPAFPDETRA